MASGYYVAFRCNDCNQLFFVTRDKAGPLPYTPTIKAGLGSSILSLFQRLAAPPCPQCGSNNTRYCPEVKT